MTHIARNRVMELSTSTGTGAFAVSGSIAGHRTFSSVCSVSDTFWGYIEAVDANGVPTGDWEDGLYTYSALNTITRTTVRNSSNGGAAVNFAAGNKIVALGVFAPEDATSRGEWRTLIGAAETGSNSSITGLTACTSITGLTGLNGGAVVPRGHIDGLTLSTAGSSATFSIAPGAATDDGVSLVMALASALNKTTGAWTVGTGNGALDTGAIANATWYHVWLIRRPDTGVVDVLISTSATAPTMPTSYTQKRRIGALLTNGSAQWTRFVQLDDEFLWYSPTLDINVSNPGTSGALRTLVVPTNVKVQAIFNGGYRNAAASVQGGVLFTSPDQSDDAASETTGSLWNSGAAVQITSDGPRASLVQLRIWTNTSGQVRARASASDANCNLYMSTVGWRDQRGRNA